MAEGQGTTPTATVDKKGGATVPDKASTTTKSTSGSWVSTPQNYGNTAGDKIESTLSPVSNTVGKGLETVARPVGGLVDGLVGGVMRSGEAFGETVGVGYGNKKKDVGGTEEVKKDVGGGGTKEVKKGEEKDVDVQAQGQDVLKEVGDLVGGKGEAEKKGVVGDQAG